MEHEERARVVAAIYDLIDNDGEPIDTAKVLHLIEAVSKNRMTTGATDEPARQNEPPEPSTSPKPG